MPAPIRIAAALIDDGEGRVFLVRKRGTEAFMQPGGKIGPRETALEALRRELVEELGFAPGGELPFLGTFRAPAANEPGLIVEAKLFHLRVSPRSFEIAAEIDAGAWVALDEAAALPLAPFTRDDVIPLARSLSNC